MVMEIKTFGELQQGDSVFQAYVYKKHTAIIERYVREIEHFKKKVHFTITSKCINHKDYLYAYYPTNGQTSIDAHKTDRSMCYGAYAYISDNTRLFTTKDEALSWLTEQCRKRYMEACKVMAEAHELFEANNRLVLNEKITDPDLFARKLMDETEKLCKNISETQMYGVPALPQGLGVVAIPRCTPLFIGIDPAVTGSDVSVRTTIDTTNNKIVKQEIVKP